MIKLSPTPDVSVFIKLLKSGKVTAAQAASVCGFTNSESTLIRRLAGIPVQSYAPDIKERVVQLRGKGMTYRDIAEAVQISVPYVNYLLQKHRKQQKQLTN